MGPDLGKRIARPPAPPAAVSRLGLIVAATAAALFGYVALAQAGWNNSGSGGTYSKARTVPTGSTPTTSINGRNVTVSWTTSSFAGGGPNISDYTVKRYNTGGTVQSIGANCSGTVSALTCTESNLDPGSWKYSVTPKVGSNWVGTESSQSSTQVVPNPSYTLSSSPTVTSLPATLNGDLAAFKTGATVTYRLDDPSTGTVLSSTTTPSTIGNSGAASNSVTIPSGTANGSHTIYAIGSSGDQASVSITVQVPITIDYASWDFNDVSNGTSVDHVEAAAYDDNVFFPAGDGFAVANFANSFQPTRYYGWEYNSPLPPGQAVTNAKFDFRFKSNGGSEVACFYFDVISGGSTIGTYGDTTPGTASSPFCTNATEKYVSTSIPVVNTTDIANGVQIKVYGYESNNRPIQVDQAVVTGTTAGANFTLYETQGANAADGSPEVGPWELALQDAVYYGAANNYGSSFAAAKYDGFAMPSGYVPSGSTIESVSLVHRWQSGSGSTLCYYVDLFVGGSSIGTAPSPPGTDGAACFAGTGSWQTDTVPLPAIDTVSELDDLNLHLVYRTKTGGGTKPRHDYVGLQVTYH
jgi:hypothetical protein